MPADVLQRPHWNGEPTALGEMFKLRKDGREAVCTLLTHQLGWDLRLIVAGEIIQTQVCRNQEEMLSTWERWHAGMKARGWK